MTRELSPDAETFEFSADTRLSGINLGGRQYRKGAADSLAAFVKKLGATHIPAELSDLVDTIARAGATPLVVSCNSEIMGVINLKDIIKAGIQERFLQLRSMGIRTVMITGDNPLTAAAIAAEVQVDDFLAQADVAVAMSTGTQPAREAANIIDLDSNPTVCSVHHHLRRHDRTDSRRAGTGLSQRA